MSVICWDFDGTLVYSNPLWSNSVYIALKETDSRVKVKFEDVRVRMAKGFTWHTPYENNDELTDDKWWDFMMNKIYNDYLYLGVDKYTAKSASRKVPLVIKRKENYTLYPDSIKVLEKSVYKGNKNILLSNNYPDLTDVLDDLNLTKYFDYIIISAKVGYDKPRKEIFDIAKNLYPTEEYIMIGDSENADIIGGKNSGMKTVLVHNGFSDKADYCIDNLSDFKF
ncbi:MAG: HAD family hydrolase [Acetobacter sp.]|nr:HAD family hydrolase [Bacteroides sp.]MCM1341059.1 HAD family hydrolase [Acetobacter sp.]MCM1432385.1 HAD family hydrolase [Clostridiales bacterium]